MPRSIAQIARSTATLRVSVSFLLRRLCCFFCCCCWLVASSRSLARSFGSRLVVAFALIAAVPRRYLAGDRTLVARRCSAVISLVRLESLFAKGVDRSHARTLYDTSIVRGTRVYSTTPARVLPPLSLVLHVYPHAPWRT